MIASSADKSGRARLAVRLAAPRGFCAGVERAIRAVEDALAAYGPPVYVRHEIVHNTHVVNRLKAMGAVFIEDLDAAPADRPVVLSAHGSPRAVHDAAAARNMHVIDATCPLVQKVHAETRRNAARGRHVLLVGHAGHPEVVGTMGQAPEGAVTLVETCADAEAVSPPAGPLAYVTQTTLSVDDAAEIVRILKRRFPAIEGPRRSDICYATSNRQAAAKRIAPGADLVVVIGSPASSNSRRLVDTALAAGAARAILLDAPETFDLDSLEDAQTIGLTAGASAPEVLVETFLARLAARFRLTIETVEAAAEDVVFKPAMMAAG
ncbi:4-hydroxy-3-methylbut-2-enyl diphosphate reductase [Amphiplicatus metriothermophilus]|uniref:4-hydroxy-3-methylbut-2-enyl diphosphate reductase n=1 Tax=Amphiplicatus metriothermophilus TaxID=1519374 RepID=A0A239PQF9_9PROT|nr:4-hydroxy-3-methylbut-2-enyl diphosphate reductase [Amphiplicatus metriothermophilus]MBB5518661.1 4-hydroxy-3-methylbut-2-enyl diphosphate reductase [Amphiplicatus metriothermophilus]SNT72182.1 4-hydroxy-3-methylbut-2-enyl diphosphate reductase [Amphiplicatus metriothermophilus]